MPENNDSADRQVAQALTQIPFLSDVDVELRPCDKSEERIVAAFMSTGCGCKQNCYLLFSANYVGTFRLHCLELTIQELDLAILGQLAAFTNTSDSTAEDCHHVVSVRKNSYSTYHHQGKPVCWSMFAFLFTVGRKRMRNLADNYLKNGLKPRVHGNSRRKPHHALSFESIEKWSGLFQLIQSRMLFCYRDEYQGTAGQILGCYHQAHLSEEFGECMLLLLRQPIFMQQLTPHFASFGKPSFHLLSS